MAGQLADSAAKWLREARHWNEVVCHLSGEILEHVALPWHVLGSLEKDLSAYP